MPTKRKQRTHGRSLDHNTRMHLILGTGCNNWKPEETERYRQAWNQHGARLLAECERHGHPRPMAECVFGPPKRREESDAD